MIMNDKLEQKWKGTVLVILRYCLSYSLDRTEDNHKGTQSGYTVPKLNTFQTSSKSVNQYAVMFGPCLKETVPGYETSKAYFR